MRRPPAPRVDIHIDEVVLNGAHEQHAIVQEVTRALIEAGVDAESIDAELHKALKEAMPR